MYVWIEYNEVCRLNFWDETLRALIGIVTGKRCKRFSITFWDILICIHKFYKKMYSQQHVSLRHFGFCTDLISTALGLISNCKGITCRAVDRTVSKCKHLCLF
jgi:predicted component of viral defense system (DUF524 family)